MLQEVIVIEELINVIKTEYENSNIDLILLKFIGKDLSRKTKTEEVGQLHKIVIYCPLWVMTVSAKFKRFFLGHYQIATGVAVDAWTGQAGSIGLMPGCEEAHVPKVKILATEYSKEYAEEQARLFLEDVLTIKYRSVPYLDIKKTNLIYQPVWISKYTNNQGKVKYIMVDAVSGRQLFRYDNLISELIEKLPIIENFM